MRDVRRRISCTRKVVYYRLEFPLTISGLVYVAMVMIYFAHHLVTLALSF